tara:strand:- start:80 stop:436 length:357 start_codon:yes stop_codon:yes gene_type:complete
MAEDPTTVGEHTLFGFKYTIPEEDNPATQVITGEGENTVINYTLTNGTISATLTMDKSKFGADPDITFDDELDKFQYVDDSYLENNPGTIDNTIIAYVGSFFSDTVAAQATLTEEDLE